MMKKQEIHETSHQQVQIEDLLVNEEQAEGVKGSQGSGHFTQMTRASTRY
jgi:hypothetical protein